ncbi:MAG: hypothetical protein ACLQRH_04705 [Acidimicrobiales bacterium]
MPNPTVVTSALPGHTRPAPASVPFDRLRIVPWEDPIADPHGVHPCSRYVELYWLGVLGPSATANEPIEAWLPNAGQSSIVAEVSALAPWSAPIQEG